MNYKCQRDNSSGVCSFHLSREQDQNALSLGTILSLCGTCGRFKTCDPVGVMMCNHVHRCNHAPDQAQLIQMVVWMLQRRLLIQLHTYVCLLVPPCEDEPGLRDEDPPLAARLGGRSLSTPSALSFGSPSTSFAQLSLLCPSFRGYIVALHNRGSIICCLQEIMNVKLPVI